MNLQALIADLKVHPPARAGWQSVRICDLTEDSRTVVPGSLFVARRGLKSDGGVFARDAVRAGAVAILTDDASLRGLETGHDGVPVVLADSVALVSALLAERFYGNPSARLAAIAVTGTNGKTTTTWLVWQILNALGVRCGLIGTVVIDDGRSVGPANMTTPPAIELSRSMATMVEAGCRAVALEASSHALDQRRIDGLALKVGVFTNLTGDHLDYHKTMEGYAAAKGRLFEMLPAGGTAIINTDDPGAESMVKGCRAGVRRDCLRVGSPSVPEPSVPGRECRGWVEILSSTIDGMSLRLGGGWGVLEASVPLIGRYNAMNVLQAVECCDAVSEELLGRRLSTEDLALAMKRVSAPPGRLEPARVGASRSRGTSVVAGLPRVFVDYAHTDDALRNVLSAVRGVIDPPAKLWVVFGAGGDKDKTKRPRMGAAAAELADRIVITSDNPRSEKPSAIVADILAGVPERDRAKVEVQVERGPAIRHAVQAAGGHDVVVIAGKGHETEQTLLDERGRVVTIEFDDRLVAGKALADRKHRGGRGGGAESGPEVTPSPGAARPASRARSTT